jgi:HEAT repeat protein
MLVIALPTCGDAIGSAITTLKRAGDAGAEVLIDQLLSSDSMDVRRACFDALAEVRRGTAQLLTMLDHEQWFVARNAACLLGLFGSRSSEPELTATLAHSDERVRAAVITSLLQLDTPSSRATVRGAIRDSSAEVRRRAVRGFLAEPGATANADKVLQALERETDLDVQLEFLYALGSMATPDAVQKLIRLCSADGRYRPPDFRIAAAEALASARLGASVPLLRAMLKDPDIHARAAARHLIRAVS